MKQKRSESFKIQVVEKALKRGSGQTLESIADHCGIGYSTLSRWIQMAKAGVLGDKNHGIGSKEKRPQDWTVEDQFQAVVDTHGMSEQACGQYCREHGIYGHQLEQWKQAFMSKSKQEQTQDYKTQLRDLKAENLRLERELRRKDKALAETAALLVLKKKVQALYGLDEEK